MNLPEKFYDYRLYIFDLDNTLYAETQYLHAAYRRIEEHFAQPGIADFLLREFETHGRINLFDKLINTYQLPPESLERCLRILRTVQVPGGLAVFHHISNLLYALKAQHKRLALLTNGHPAQQQNKIRQMNIPLAEIFDVIVFADEIQPKPSPAGVHYLLNHFHLPAADALMIGDSDTDRTAAEKAGVNFIQAQHLREM
ncbi:MAG: HAD family hydrolase [Chitinophagales bacterium]|nr:HAD family hydrolase [Chitinophagales bacterium]MDW8418229.1 HAD-IA family hydrolase [Chitinophagales bacterium]